MAVADQRYLPGPRREPALLTEHSDRSVGFRGVSVEGSPQRGSTMAAD